MMIMIIMMDVGWLDLNSVAILCHQCLRKCFVLGVNPRQNLCSVHSVLRPCPVTFDKPSRLPKRGVGNPCILVLGLVGRGEVSLSESPQLAPMICHCLLCAHPSG